MLFLPILLISLSKDDVSIEKIEEYCKNNNKIVIMEGVPFSKNKIEVNKQNSNIDLPERMAEDYDFKVNKKDNFLIFKKNYKSHLEFPEITTHECLNILKILYKSNNLNLIRSEYKNIEITNLISTFPKNKKTIFISDLSPDQRKKCLQISYGFSLGGIFDFTPWLEKSLVDIGDPDGLLFYDTMLLKDQTILNIYSAIKSETISPNPTYLFNPAKSVANSVNYSPVFSKKSINLEMLSKTLMESNNKITVSISPIIAGRTLTIYGDYQSQPEMTLKIASDLLGFKYTKILSGEKSELTISPVRKTFTGNIPDLQIFLKSLLPDNVISYFSSANSIDNKVYPDSFETKFDEVVSNFFKIIKPYKDKNNLIELKNCPDAIRNYISFLIMCRFFEKTYNLYKYPLPPLLNSFDQLYISLDEENSKGQTGDRFIFYLPQSDGNQLAVAGITLFRPKK